MRHAVLSSTALALAAFGIAGCSMMSNGYSAHNPPSATTREQCRQQGATAGPATGGRNAMTSKIDIDCATIMPN